jgi:hypothetical protein
MSCLILSHFVAKQETFSSLAKALAPICRVDGSSLTQYVEVMKGEAGSRGFSSICPFDIPYECRKGQPVIFRATLYGLFLPDVVFAEVNPRLLHCGGGLESSQRGLHAPCRDAAPLQRVPQSLIDAGVIRIPAN